MLGLYILGRCLEDKGSWTELGDVYYRMLAIFNSARDMGLDSISFRKMKYRLAILNEREYNDPGLGVIRSLIAENPSYDKYHLALRWMLWKHPELLEPELEEEDGDESGEERCQLVEMALDQNCSEEEFLDRLRVARTDKNDDWNGYRHIINGLKLPMAF